ncbi:MAG: 1-acyl-sn-glycerol-3-phosphate acyltransferase [Gammaproteobacteria bacterium]|nr:1-acyl-sn-glycerol-3-phosphate acyltransferase [Gammaproteobacteria bacterium]MBU6509299.1 1-acyl-sn-glycerol-3-phosphate acyltransferase [Gammaproteobacteria bacterium]MDE1983500.1 1-acyl-sn-glycerol-3-phosphate acyltransferase [Gammaproteobacteria bacterium]MDE2107915.1 1-acyl-sn-glycerol-3-phosphate acyltransferase [Gammaproteobacteria bacterium]MDE2460264.1 1-acyl-sn-glycerol-3-phosphate acyltransferase [Gammaproteobacteria bacterium]
MIWLRSLIYNLFMGGTAVLFSIPVALVSPFPSGKHLGHWIARQWVVWQFFVLKHLCRLTYEAQGLENIPRENAITYWKHQSTWETMAQLLIFPPQSWVLKRELLWLPVIGQAIYALEPIAINRQAGHSAVKQVLEMGQARLNAGLWVAIMPEGTRMPPGTTRRYGLSGALLAQKTGRPIVPVAHNAGDFWKRNAFLKYPGTIQVRVGKPVYANARPPGEVNAEIQNWIETQMKELSPGYQGTFQPKPRLR